MMFSISDFDWLSRLGRGMTMPHKSPITRSFSSPADACGADQAVVVETKGRSSVDMLVKIASTRSIHGTGFSSPSDSLSSAP